MVVRGGIDPKFINWDTLEVKCANPNCTNAISGLSRYCSKRCSDEHYRILHPDAHKNWYKKNKEKERKEKMKKDPKFKYAEMLRCPYCGSGRTWWRREEEKMQCDKCGHTFERPPIPQELKK